MQEEEGDDDDGEEGVNAAANGCDVGRRSFVSIYYLVNTVYVAFTSVL